MKLTPYNGSLSPQGAFEVSEGLDTLLSDIQVYHQNLRQVQWNKRIRLHFDLNQAIHPLYQAADAGTHIVAERIMELGHKPTSSVSEALIQTRLEPVYEVESYEDAMQMIITNSRQLLEVVREVMEIAAKYKDQRTLVMLSHLGNYLIQTIQHFSVLRMAKMN